MLRNYQHVNVESTNGDGMLFDYGNYDLKDIGSLNVSVNPAGDVGMGGDAINLFMTVTSVKLANNVTLSTASNYGAGIYLESRGTGEIDIGDNLNVYAKHGMGVAAEVADFGSYNRIGIGDNAVIRTEGDGQNIYKGTGYGVFSGSGLYLLGREDDVVRSSAQVKIGDNADVQTRGANAHAIYANKTGLIQTGNITVET